MTRHIIGAKVVTVRNPNFDPRGWTPSALFLRTWDAPGTVVKVSDSHGLVYGVRHADGVVAYYEHEELESRP